MIKYILIPDYVPSDDGDLHFITPNQLAHLYKVDMKECEVAPHPSRRQGWEAPKNLLALTPRFNGDYTWSTQQ